jgi:predicted ester cyclase
MTTDTGLAADAATLADNAALALAVFEVMRTGDLADFERITHPDAVNREAVDEPPECRGTGPAAFHATKVWLHEAFADLRWDVHDVVAQDDLVVVHCTMRGRHEADFVTFRPDGDVADAFPPTGRTFASTQSHWLRFAGGRVIEHWANRDDMGTAFQLGWVPPGPRYLWRMARAKRRARRRYGSPARG